MDDKRLSIVLNFLKLLPLLLVIAIIFVFGGTLKTASVEDILKYTPENVLLAACTIIGLYAVKSFSVIFPLIALYVCAGILFSPPIAVLVNIIGLGVAVTLPYLVGRLSGKSYIDKLVFRYKRMQKLSTFWSTNQGFTCFILRAINLLPGDIVSMFLGASGIRYVPYLTGSLLGLVPFMIPATLLGEVITNPKSPAFLISILSMIAVSGISILLYWFLTKRKKR